MQKIILKNQIIQHIESEFFEGTFDEVINNLKELKKQHSNLNNLKILYQQNYSDDYFVLVGDRIETDEEFEARKAQEERNKNKKRKKLEKLLSDMSKEEIKEFLKLAQNHSH